MRGNIAETLRESGLRSWGPGSLTKYHAISARRILPTTPFLLQSPLFRLVAGVNLNKIYTACKYPSERTTPSVQKTVKIDAVTVIEC